MIDFEAAQKEFEERREATAERLRRCIDARLALIRQDVPQAGFCDAMGTSFLYDKARKDMHESLTGDPLYLAWEHFLNGSEPQREFGEGEIVEPAHLRTIALFDKYRTIMKEVDDITTYLWDTVGSVYGRD